MKTEGRAALSALKELTEEGMAATKGGGLSAEQAVQEAEYEFPYHYIPRLEGGNFTQVRKLRWGYEYLSYLRFVLARLERVEFDSLLDVGCGEGRFLREVSRRFPGKRLLGVDFSARAVEYARLLNPGLRFAREDIADAAAPSKGFDVVTLIETLEHVPPGELREFVEGLRRRTRDGGLLVVSVPSKNIKMSAKHYQHFDLDLLKTTLAPFFEVVEHYYLNRISKWDKLLSALLDEQVLHTQRASNAERHLPPLRAQPARRARVGLQEDLCRMQTGLASRVGRKGETRRARAASSNPRVVEDSLHLQGRPAPPHGEPPLDVEERRGGEAARARSLARSPARRDERGRGRGRARVRARRLRHNGELSARARPARHVARARPSRLRLPLGGLGARARLRPRLEPRVSRGRLRLGLRAADGLRAPPPFYGAAVEGRAAHARARGVQGRRRHLRRSPPHAHRRRPARREGRHRAQRR